MSRHTDRLARPIRALALTVAPGALCLAPSAFARTEAGVDVSISGTVASNPDLLKDPQSGVSGLATATPWLRFDDDLTHVGVLGNIQVEKYTRRFGTNVSGSASVGAQRRLSTHVTLDASLAYRRTSRILDDFLLRGGGGTSPNTGGEVELPTSPLPDVSFGTARTRNESYEGDLSINVIPSERGQLTLAAGVRAARYEALDASNLNAYTASAAYGHMLSERTSLNVNTSFGRSDFLGTRVGDGSNVSAQVGASQKFGATLVLSGSVGATLSRSRRSDGSIRSFTVLSGDLSLCKTAERTKYCLIAERSAESAALGGASATNQVKFNLATSIGQFNSLTADVFYAHYDSPTIQTAVGRVSEFIGASVSYARAFSGRRFSALITPSVVRLKDNTGAKTNFQVRVGLRYSFGGRS